MFEGALILFIGIVIGYVLVCLSIASYEKQSHSIKDLVKKSVYSQKGIIVDLSPSVDLGEPINENNKEETIK